MPLATQGGSSSAQAIAPFVARLEGVSLRYGKTMALDGVALDIPGGRMVGLVGPDGKTVLSRLQPATLRRMASDTNCRFATASGGADTPAMVKLATKDLDEFEMKGRDRRLVIEFYQWLVLPAVLFLMISIAAGTRWRGINAPAALAFAFLACLQSSPASEESDAAALLAQGHHSEAQSAFSKLAKETRLPGHAARFSLGEATAAYRAALGEPR